MSSPALSTRSTQASRGPPGRPAGERRPGRHRHRDRARGPADAGAGRHRRERRAPPHRHRPRLRPGLAVLGAQRLHARLRRAAPARRPARRRPRPAPDVRDRPERLHPRSRCSAASPRPRPSWSSPAPCRASGAAMAAPSVLALLTTSAPDEAARNRALALFGAVSSAGASIGLLLGGVVTDLGSWRWTLFINVPIGLAVLLLARRFVDRDPAAPRPLRRRRRGHRDPRRGRDRLVADRHARSTAGCRCAPSPASSSASACSLVLGRTEVRAPAPADPAAPGPQPPPGRRPGRDGAGRSARTCRCSSWSCSTTSGCSASARSPPAWPSCPFSLARLRDVAGHPVADRAGSARGR